MSNNGQCVDEMMKGHSITGYLEVQPHHTKIVLMKWCRSIAGYRTLNSTHSTSELCLLNDESKGVTETLLST